MLKKFFLFSILLALIGCSQSEDIQINIPITSKVENLISHSEEFKQQVLSYETPGGRIHFAIGFGIANSIMVEGEDGNIIIDGINTNIELHKWILSQKEFIKGSYNTNWLEKNIIKFN